MKAQSGDDRRGTVQLQTDFSEHAQQCTAKGTLDLEPFKRSGTHKFSMNSSGGRTNLLPWLQILFFSIFSLLALWLQLCCFNSLLWWTQQAACKGDVLSTKDVSSTLGGCYESKNWFVQPYSFWRATDINVITCMVQIFTNVMSAHSMPDRDIILPSHACWELLWCKIVTFNKNVCPDK